MKIVGFIFVFALIISLYGLLNFYAARRLFQFISFLFPRVNVKIFSVIYILIALTIIIGFMPIPRIVDRFINNISSFWMGIFVYLVMLLVLSDIVVLILRLIKVVPSSPSVRFYATLVAVTLTACIITYGTYNATQIKNVSYDIELNKELDSEMKVVLISDIHLGAVGSEKRLSKTIKEINKAKPDIVCIAGDIFNDDYNSIKNPEKIKELLKSIDSKHGVYAILGNHDGGKTFAKMTEFLKECDVVLLNDEHIVIDNRIVLVGRVDGSPIGGFGDIMR